jgi:Tfp pilus assembly major pilin PilA
MHLWKKARQSSIIQCFCQQQAAASTATTTTTVGFASALQQNKRIKSDGWYKQIPLLHI